MRFQRLTAWMKRIPSAWRWAGVVWLCGRILLSVWGVLIFNTGLIPSPAVQAEHYYNIQPVTSGPAGALLGVWQRWDTLHYQRILLYGYASSPELSAFFPLYPLLARGLTWLTGMDSLAALLVVSNAAFYLLLVALYRLVEQDFDASTARRVLAVTVLFPTAFFFYAGYPLSLALLFTLLAYLSARNGRWFMAALAGILAGLSHSTVMPLAAMLLYEALRQGRKTRAWTDLLKLPAALASLMGVAIFLAWRAGQGFPPLAELMSGVWERVVQPPWKTLLDIPVQFRTGPVYGSLYTDLLLLGVMLAAGVWGFRRLRAAEWIYHLTLLGYLLVTTIRGQPLASFGRYMLMSFPTFLLAGLLAKKKWLRLVGFTVGLSLELFLSAVFFLWGWVD